MKSVETILEQLCGYYQYTRGCGHTKAMLEGAKNADCFVVVPSMEIGRYVVMAPKEKLITLARLERLMGHKKPLAFDNSTLFTIFREALSEIRELKQREKHSET